MSESNQQAGAIFDAALHVPRAQRTAYLEKACAANGPLRHRVETLLRAHEAAGGFMNSPALPPMPATVIAEPTEHLNDTIGRYKLLQKIGEGGCGLVYMADQTEPVRRRVALKVIKLGMDTKAVIARFEAERQALAMMDHPNIAKVLDAGATESGRPYFVMELVRGVKITGFCDQNHLATQQRLELFTQTCEAIQHAHQKGIIHRDIKPSNVLVTVNDGVPVPKVIDFGIAKATTGQQLTDKTLFTAFEQFIGTPAYMSPEQALMTSLDIDTRSDIYALGVLLYEMLTGRTPFNANELLASGLEGMRRTILEKEPVRPSTRLSAMLEDELATTAKARQSDAPKLISMLRGDLDWIVMKAIEKDRARRYETANGLAMDVKRFLGNEPVVARPPSTAYRLHKAFRRNKLAFSAGSAVAVALILGLGLSTWLFIRESEAHQQAHAAELEQNRLRQQAETTAQRESEQRHRADHERERAENEKVEARRHLYAAKMNLAQQAWEQNHIDRLRDLLEETQESPDRGFEWYYWQRQSHALRTLAGHFGPVWAVAFSPDGQRIVTGGEVDRTAKVWEAASGKELITLKGHGAAIKSLAFSPDGRRIVTGGWDQTAKVWEVASGKELLTVKGHTAPIWSVAFSPHGELIASGSLDQTAKLWDAASGKELLTLEGHSAGINSVAFSPDGQRIVTGSMDQTAKVWDAASGKELLALKGHSAGINSVAFSPDGQRIVTGSEDQTAKAWEAASGKELSTFSGHNSWIFSVAYSPDGHRIVTGSTDNTAKVWDAAAGKELFTLKGHTSWVTSVAYSQDGQRIVTASGDDTAKMWDAARGREPLTLEGHRAPIKSVALSPDGQRIVTGSDDQTAKMWDTASGRELLTLKGHGAGISSVAFSTDGQRIVTGSEDQTVKVWEAATGRDLLTLEGHSAHILSVGISPDGQRIVAGSSDPMARVWETASGRKVLTLEGHRGQVLSVAFSSDGRRIVTGSSDSTAIVWDAASGRELFPLKGHSNSFLSSGWIGSVAFSPDGRRIVTGSSDQTAKVWDADSGTNLLTLKGHSAPIDSVAFSPDSHRIVTGSGDHTAKVWETATGRELLTLKGHTLGIGSVAFSPDGQRIVTASDDQTAKVWEAVRAEQVDAWQEEEQAAGRYLADFRRDWFAEQKRQWNTHASDEGAIKRWLILAPIALDSGQSGAEGLDAEQIKGEGGLRPKAGQREPLEVGERTWQEVAQQDYLIDFLIDFIAILGRVTEHSVAYAVCYIRSEAEQDGLRMLVGSDEQAKVYLNGKQIYKYPFPRPCVVDQDMVPDISLNAGLNVLVLKVVNNIGFWGGSIRFTDAQGNLVKGIKVTLDPDAKELR